MRCKPNSVGRTLAGRVCPQRAASLQHSSNGALETDAPYPFLGVANLTAQAVSNASWLRQFSRVILEF